MFIGLIPSKLLLFFSSLQVLYLHTYCYLLFFLLFFAFLSWALSFCQKWQHHCHPNSRRKDPSCNFCKITLNKDRQLSYINSHSQISPHIRKIAWGLPPSVLFVKLVTVDVLSLSRVTQPLSVLNNSWFTQQFSNIYTLTDGKLCSTTFTLCSWRCAVPFSYATQLLSVCHLE